MCQHTQLFFLLKWGLMTFWLGLAWNHDPPNFCLPVVRITGVVTTFGHTITFDRSQVFFARSQRGLLICSVTEKCCSEKGEDLREWRGHVLEDIKSVS
jgi:hypothetical protein